MADESPRVAVTGATGFIGSSIVKTLAQQGRPVLGLDLDTESPAPLFEDYLGDLTEQVTLESVDLRDADRMDEIAAEYDISDVIHAAVFTAVSEDIERERSREILETNLMGTVNTFELAREAAVDNFVYVSSSGVYGSSDNVNVPVTEHSQDPYLQSRGFYEISKVSSERIVDKYAELLPTVAVSTRIAAPYGPMERPTSTRRKMGPIYRLLEMVIEEDKDVVRVNGLAYVRDWTHVMDIAAGVVSGLNADERSVYNVTHGRNYSLQEILDAVQAVPELDFEWETVDDEEHADLTASVSSLRGPLSNLKARNELGYEPAYPLEKGVRDYAQWWIRAAEAGHW